MDEEARTVVVGVDGSPQSKEAARWAADFAGSTHARLVLAIAWHWPVSLGQPFGDPERDARTHVMKAKADLAFPTDRLEIVIREGMPGKTLVAIAQGATALGANRMARRCPPSPRPRGKQPWSWSALANKDDFAAWPGNPLPSS